MMGVRARVAGTPEDKVRKEVRPADTIPMAQATMPMTGRGMNMAALLRRMTMTKRMVMNLVTKMTRMMTMSMKTLMPERMMTMRSMKVRETGVAAVAAHKEVTNTLPRVRAQARATIRAEAETGDPGGMMAVLKETIRKVITNILPAVADLKATEAVVAVRAEIPVATKGTKGAAARAEAPAAQEATTTTLKVITNIPQAAIPVVQLTGSQVAPAAADQKTQAEAAVLEVAKAAVMVIIRKVITSTPPVTVVHAMEDVQPAHLHVVHPEEADKAARAAEAAAQEEVVLLHPVHPEAPEEVSLEGK